MVDYADTVLVYAGLSSMGRGHKNIVQYNPELTKWSIRPNTITDTPSPILAATFNELFC